MALSLDLVVTVCQPHDERRMLPLLKIVAIGFPCSVTVVLLSLSTLTQVLDLDQLRRSTIADCISDSILGMSAQAGVLFYYTQESHYDVLYVPLYKLA